MTDTLDIFLNELMESRQEILQDFIDCITQAYLDLKESESKQEYEDCVKQLRAIEFQLEYFVILMQDISSPNQIENNRALLELMRQSIKEKIWK